MTWSDKETPAAGAHSDESPASGLWVEGPPIYMGMTGLYMGKPDTYMGMGILSHRTGAYGEESPASGIAVEDAEQEGVWADE